MSAARIRTDSDVAGSSADAPEHAPEHVDVLVIGAGLSGIGAACRLRIECPWATFAVLEARDDLGGTWSSQTRCTCTCSSTLIFKITTGTISR